MTIQALPSSTALMLSSAQVLVDPVSIVKELVDNALDAKATSIEVSISSNTVDKIEVRDNGHGIDSEDLNALGRRGYTSKIRSFEELNTVGGVSLGFRGEALASATVLGTIQITTRTDGDPLATQILLKSHGGIANQSTASHPVGTTVCVTNIFTEIPVRRQHATKDKECAKQLAKVKHLLQIYALARLRVRFRFKVFKSAKYSWSYSPRPHDGFKEAVLQVFRRELASQCTEISSRFEGKAMEVREDSFAMSSGSDFVFEGFLPRLSANPSKISKGSFVFIDSRPVACKRGTLKKIVSIYKDYLQNTQRRQDTIKDPFLLLNIVCSPGSYDPNIEPAKDDVVFADENQFLQEAKRFFLGVYGDQGSGKNKIYAENQFSTTLFTQDADLIATQHASTKVSELSVFDATMDATPELLHASLMSPTHQQPELVKTQLLLVKDSLGNLPQNKQYRKRANLLSDTGKDDTRPSPAIDIISSENLHTSVSKTMNEKVQYSDPWSIAKMAAPKNKLSTRKFTGFPSLNNPSPFADLKVQFRPLTMSLSSKISAYNPQEAPDQQDPEIHRSLQGWIHDIHPNSPNTHNLLTQLDPASLDEEMLLRNEVAMGRRGYTANPIVLSDELAEGALQSPPPTQQRSLNCRVRRTEGVHKSYKQPTRKPQHTIIQNGNAVTSMGRLSTPVALDKPSRLSYHYSNDSREHQGLECQESTFHSLLSDGDPRTYLMRRRYSMSKPSNSGISLKRSRTFLLPLETVPEVAKLQNLEQIINVKPDQFGVMLSQCHAYDDYVALGKVLHGLKFSGKPIGSQITVMQRRLKTIVNEWGTKRTETGEFDVEYDFSELFALQDIGVIS